MNQPQVENSPAREGARYRIHGHRLIRAVETLAALRGRSGVPGQPAGQAVPGGLQRSRAAIVECVIETPSPDFAVPGGGIDTTTAINLRMMTLPGGDAQFAPVS